MMKKFLYLLLFVLVIAVPARAQENEDDWYKSYDQIGYSELRKLIDDDQVEAARVLHDGWWVTIKTKQGEFFDTRVTPQTPIADHFYAAGISVKIEHRNRESDEVEDRPIWLTLALKFSPLFALWFFLIVLFVATRGFNKKIYKKNDEHLEKAGQLNRDHLAKVEEMQEAFFERLEKLLLEKNKT